jgi:hypothetical protein
MSAYLSLSKLGGLLVFGFDDLVTFCLFALPCLAFPAALLSLWKPPVGAAAFTLLTIVFLATQIHLIGFSPKHIAAKNTWISLYVVTSALLLVVAALDVSHRKSAAQEAGQN